MLRFSQFEFGEEMGLPSLKSFRSYQGFITAIDQDDSFTPLKDELLGIQRRSDDDASPGVSYQGKDLFGAIQGPSGDVLWTSSKMKISNILSGGGEVDAYRLGTEDEFLADLNQTLHEILDRDVLSREDREAMLHLITQANVG